MNNFLYEDKMIELMEINKKLMEINKKLMNAFYVIKKQLAFENIGIITDKIVKLNIYISDLLKELEKYEN